MPHDPDTIFKALRPVPEFDGNAHVLTRFIRICDQIVLSYINTDEGNELPNQCLLNGILNKITGPAATIINSNGIPDNWLGIREALINNFADQRDETALYNDLSLATQGQKTPQEFYDQCQTLFSTIMTYISLHETLKSTIDAKRDLYRKLAMQAFIRGLQEPLGSRIRCMRPETMEQALKFVQEELNIMYLQQRNESIPKAHQVPKSTPTIQALPPKPYSFPQWSAPNPQRFMPMPAQPPMHMQPRFNFSPQQQQQQQQPGFRGNLYNPQFRMPSRTQQMFGARPPNYNPQSNVFRLKQNQPFNTSPKPMSGVQHYVTKQLPPSGHDWRRHGNPPPNNYFKSREMNLNECYDEPDYYYQPDYTYEYYTDTYDSNDYPDYTYPETEIQEYYTEQPQQLTYQPQQTEGEEDTQISASSNQNFQKIPKSRKPK